MATTLTAQDEKVLKRSGLQGIIEWANFPVYSWTVQVMVIFAGSIYGGLTAFSMFASIGFNVPELAIMLTCTIIPNAFAIGQAPMKTMVPMFFGALAINTLIILLNVALALQ
ncbi:MAG: hypothetical protein KDC84_11275 [Crocinitomicaceae bacterium]|nr:hypothetical protein [Crocinitomicaceae bacterium]